MFFPFIHSIFGNVSTGKTYLAKSLVADKNYIYIDCNDIINNVEIDNYIDKKKINNGTPEVLFNKLIYADPRVISLEYNIDLPNEDMVISAKLDTDEIVPLNQISKKYHSLLYIILLIRSKNNIILDNLDVLNTGSHFKVLLELLISEIKFNKVKVVTTFTDISLWQLFSLSIPKEMEKDIIMTKYDYKEKSFDHMSIDYAQLAYSANFMFDKMMKKALSEKRQCRVSDLKEV